MIMKEKLLFRFENTHQFTLKIALNIEMQSNLNCAREAEGGGGGGGGWLLEIDK